MTINPAKQLRIDSRVGSLEVGKDADVVIWNHHPLSSYAIVERVYIDGTVYYDRKEDEGRISALQKEKSSLAAAEQGSTRPASSSSPEPPRNESLASGPKVEEVAQPAAAQAAPAPRPQTQAPQGPVQVTAITNARIHPITQPDIERGTIVIRGTTIEALGASVAVPPGAKVVDAAGADVYPGFINARTQIGLNEPGPRGFEDVNEMLDLNPQLRTRVAYHAESDAIAVARANGITTVAVMPGGGIFGGEVAVMDLAGWTWEEATLRANAGITFNFPIVGGGGRGGGGGGRGAAPDGRAYDELKRERDRRLDELATMFDQVRAYAKAGPDKTVDWTLEALMPVAQKKLPLVATANRAQDIRDAVAFADRVKVNLVISGGSEATLVAPLLKEKGVPVILGSVLTLPASEDAFHAAPYQLAGQLSRAGVKVAFSTGDSAYVRLLPYHAAMSVAWGMNRDEALKALTIHAAEVLGVSDRVGSLEPGKDANLLVSRGDPLEVRTVVTNVFINGTDVGVDDRQEQLYRKYLARP